MNRNYEIKRNICEIPFNGSYTRVKAHLLKILGAGVRVCPNITPSKLVELKKLDNEASLKIEKSKKKCVILPLASNEGQETNIGANPTKKHPLEVSFNVQGRV